MWSLSLCPVEPFSWKQFCPFSIWKLILRTYITAAIRQTFIGKAFLFRETRTETLPSYLWSHLINKWFEVENICLFEITFIFPVDNCTTWMHLLPTGLDNNKFAWSIMWHTIHAIHNEPLCDMLKEADVWSSLNQSKWIIEKD